MTDSALSTQPFLQAPARAPQAPCAALPFALAYSRYIQRLAQAREGWADRVHAAAGRPIDVAWLSARFAELFDTTAAEPETALKRALRLLRNEVFGALVERDLSGAATLDEVTGTMTDLAEFAVRAAISVIGRELEALHGQPLGQSSGEVQELVVVGMGKLGGRELNVSSDIDLIFLYDEDGDTHGGPRPLSNHEYFTKLGRRLINALADVTEDGYVFRVDMRLRPNGDAGPLACSLGMLEEYFVVQGREWERYAWIKGRVITDPTSPHAARVIQQLDRVTGPFVFRRYLDYGVIAAIRSLHAQIRNEAAKRSNGANQQRDGEGHVQARSPNIKLGRGGIREIEFVAQVFQLIRGGQDFALRVRPTLQVLRAASERGLIDAEAVARLTEAYRFLRQLEHRLQYIEDAQTHNLPGSPEDQLCVARMMGFDDYAALVAQLEAYQDEVAQQFEQTFSDKQDSQPPCAAVWHADLLDDEHTETARAQLAELGYADPDSVLERLRATRNSPRYRALSEVSRQRFDLLINRAIDQASRQTDADVTIARFLDFFDAISRRASYLSLLSEYPQAMERVAHTLHASRWAADYLTHHPQLLDELLDVEALSAAPDWPAFKERVRDRLRAAADHVEMQMDILRQEHHAETFRVLLQDLQGMLSVEHISDRLSDLADAMLDLTLETVWQQVGTRHREVPRFAVVAYGRLGGKELGYASDLDIIFLYDDDDERAPDVYASFARKLITWLTSHTAAGMLFDVDTRLRPNGAAGLMVTHFEAFRRYQMREGDNAAWVWEHQALTRARFCAGDAEIGQRFEALRTEVLRQPREPGPLRDEIVAMRERVAEGHANPTELFDLKHDRGGMVDIEFTVQFLVLLHSAVHPELTRNKGNIALLHMAGELGLIDAARAAQVADAYRDFRARQHKLRLDGQSAARVPAGTCAHEAAQVQALWQQVFGPAQ
ncbi:bifunctional [glutamate--ammonia ligase]-adenylyl-L-tyrosine phosphorylase/[glutamate--ammonia-ligase] adenylyltransferase [Ralstonia mannitolilytica]|uniref:bifunctional [glutamate--ammonia ligase]-adenylyl-L-tyrosine phosphorylase/[glutamate--ammonia-ligase] adenylyltransferase n=1 Tax=Ralstonia mannitolilytica TaxID=105219 RepID=UPI0028F620FF|nr:bifunctional [glutamate--ammonia ligase]-adenylyl-L-tyrosine phosphorylase/[glutamate--ammonia-ligase] adenylyltransferase [Ralstonia mannitolilytica]CAJ0693340.1 Bifunctional glutamine synthetase adenylyltransferase/adenylyl-removing enzyme [Ralstonia mannitolilytica]CAJ0712064.1 Bifunctional glutamine synthetase adenylyltransferase/adenylyl-removing enzyme [Ralstonia mannitolilytica]